MDSREEANEQSTTDSHLSQLECFGTDVANNACADLDQPGLQDSQRPVGYRLWQFSALREDPEFVSQRMQMEAHLALRHALAGHATYMVLNS